MTTCGDERVPAIVMGRGPTALGILRSLQMAGIPAYVACPAGDIVTHSRWFRPTPGAVPWDGQPGEHALAALRAMPLEKAVIIAGADDAALWLADLPSSDLGERFLVSTSSRDAQSLLQDKAVFAGYLAAAHIPHPRTYRIASLEDIDAIPFATMDRVFIKPVNSQRFSDVTGVKGIWVDRPEALREAWARLHAQGFSLMAQEYVPGPASEHFFVDGFRGANGAYGGVFARRRLRMSPPDFGNSSCCHSVPLAILPEAIRQLRRLLDGLDYRGIFSAEFKRDPRDGVYRIIEVNTRAWTYVEFAARCGMNVCEMAWQDAQGLPVTRATADYPEGVACVDLYHDIPTVLALRKRQRLPWLRVLGQWASAQLHTFRWDDPQPAIAFVRGILRKRFLRSVGAPERRSDILQGAPFGGDPETKGGGGTH
ncbi:D-aspartate ligase [Luteibacter sp. HA06]|jgi:predicted ATP-grasp superfamily ATP-dependent carboligase